jgi:hypothetical protein
MLIYAILRLLRCFTLDKFETRMALCSFTLYYTCYAALRWVKTGITLSYAALHWVNLKQDWHYAHLHYITPVTLGKDRHYPQLCCITLGKFGTRLALSSFMLYYACSHYTTLSYAV